MLYNRVGRSKKTDRFRCQFTPYTYMKKAIITLIALAGAASAETILNTDFTTVTSQPTEWTSGQWNGWNKPHFNFGENGAVIAQPWKQNTLSTEVTLSPNDSYNITFTTFGNTNEQSLEFYLASSTGAYSVVMGSSYNSNNFISVGTLNQDIIECTAQNQNSQGLVTFQTTGGGVGKVHPEVLKDSGTTFTTAFVPLTYSLTLKGSSLSFSVTDGTKTWSDKITIKENVSFDTVGFILDGGVGNAGVKSISIVSVPEPATATLSLLALVGLAARRRRLA